MERSDLVKILILVSLHGWLSHCMAGYMSPGPYLMSLSQGLAGIVLFLSWLQCKCVVGKGEELVNKKSTLEILLQQELKSAEKKKYCHKNPQNIDLVLNQKPKKIMRISYNTASQYTHQFR